MTYHTKVMRADVSTLRASQPDRLLCELSQRCNGRTVSPWALLADGSNIFASQSNCSSCERNCITIAQIPTTFG